MSDLHSLWDGFLIAKAVRTVPRNYSRPLPYPKIEGALRGTIYDSYIRRIMWEGLLNPWAGNASHWLSCAAPTDKPDSDSVTTNSGLLGAWQSAFQATTKLVQTLIMKEGVEITPDGPVVCPHYWAQPLHQLNCEIVWPKELDDVRYHGRIHADDAPHAHDCGDGDGDDDDDDDNDEGSDPDSDPDDSDPDTTDGGLLDLDTPEYAGVIEKRMLVEKLLAQGGIRLAGLLNYLFAREGPELGMFIVNM